MCYLPSLLLFTPRFSQNPVFLPSVVTSQALAPRSWPGLFHGAGIQFFRFWKTLCSWDSLWSECSLGLARQPVWILPRLPPDRVWPCDLSRSLARSLTFSVPGSFSSRGTGPARLLSSQGAPSFVPAPGVGPPRVGQPARPAEWAPGLSPTAAAGRAFHPDAPGASHPAGLGRNAPAGAGLAPRTPAPAASRPRGGPQTPGVGVEGVAGAAARGPRRRRGEGRAAGRAWRS